MRGNYIKYRVVYEGPKYLCTNHKLTDDIKKARVFSSASAAYDFARFDISCGIAQIYAYAPGRSRTVVVFGD